MLEVKNLLVVRDGNTILDNVSFRLEDNQTLLITGANGSGKSTLVKAIMGIEPINGGTILFNGQDITNFDITTRAKLGIAFAFQQPIKFKGITVSDMIDISSSSTLSHKQKCKLLSCIGLCTKDYLNREIDDTLSGGELKRIEIATILNRNLPLTILDEPEAGIDLWSFEKLSALFKSFKEQGERALILISHQERIFSLADKIMVLSRGKVAMFGDAEQILKKIKDKK